MKGTFEPDFNLVKAGMYLGDVLVWDAKARGLAEVLSVYSDGHVGGKDLIAAYYAINCYAELINQDDKTEAEHDEFARFIIRDHCYALADKMVDHIGCTPVMPSPEDSIPLSVFENTLMQRALQRWSKFLRDELKVRPKQAKAA